MSINNKVDFIANMASGDTVICPKCEFVNKLDSEFCVSCGFKIANLHTVENNSVAFESIKTTPSQTNKQDSNNTFASGLPDWDIVPPQVVVRRF